MDYSVTKIKITKTHDHVAAEITDVFDKTITVYCKSVTVTDGKYHPNIITPITFYIQTVDGVEMSGVCREVIYNETQ